MSKASDTPQISADSWRFQMARFESFKVPPDLKDKLSAFSSLYTINDNIWTRKHKDMPNLEMALSIGMPINSVMRSITIQIEKRQEGIYDVAEKINNQLKAHGLIPESCKIIVLASLQLRNISDPASWASKPFPVAPVFYHPSDSQTKKKYNSHIRAIRDEFPATHISDFQTVTGSLCDGSSDISSLLIMVGNKDECHEIKKIGGLKVIVKSEKVNNIKKVNKTAYTLFCDSLCNAHENECCDTNVPVYATMLLGLLKYWDVMVITANNICLNAGGQPRGLAGFILCFERGDDEVEQFFPLANSLFAPLIHLYAKAALIEGAQYFHDSKESAGKALSKLRNAINELQEQRNQLHESISGSYGEDLALFREDLEFKRSDKESLFMKVFNTCTPDEKKHWGRRGIWHVTWKDIGQNGRLAKLKRWLNETCPKGRYPHLWDDQNYFLVSFVDAVKAIRNANAWAECFGSQSQKRLEFLFLSALCKEKNNKDKEKIKELHNSLIFEDFPSKGLFYGFDIFVPHLENILTGILSNFSDYEAYARIYPGKFIVELKAPFDKYFSKEMIRGCYNKIKQVQGTTLFSEWTKIRYMPVMWNKLYHRKAEIAWLNNGESNKDNHPILLSTVGKKLILKGIDEDGDNKFKITEYRFFFNE